MYFLVIINIIKTIEDDKNQKTEVYYSRDSFLDFKHIFAIMSSKILSAASNPILFIPSNSLLLGIWVSLVKLFKADFKLVLYL